MRRLILKSNGIYDEISEPWKFILMFMLAFPIYFLSAENNRVRLISAGWLLLVVLWRMAGYMLSEMETGTFKKQDEV